MLKYTQVLSRMKMLQTFFSQEFATLIRIHLRTTQRIAEWCWRARILAFKIRPKHHYLYHVACEVESTSLSPRMFHTWEDEKWLGALKRVALKCHGKSIQKRVLQRWILGLAHFMRES